MCDAFWQVMAFYALLSCVIGPLIGKHFKGPEGLGQGYIAGTVLQGSRSAAEKRHRAGALHCQRDC